MFFFIGNPICNWCDVWALVSFPPKKTAKLIAAPPNQNRLVQLKYHRNKPVIIWKGFSSDTFFQFPVYKQKTKNTQKKQPKKLDESFLQNGSCLTTLTAWRSLFYTKSERGPWLSTQKECWDKRTDVMFQGKHWHLANKKLWKDMIYTWKHYTHYIHDSTPKMKIMEAENLKIVEKYCNDSFKSVCSPRVKLFQLQHFNCCPWPGIFSPTFLVYMVSWQLIQMIQM